MRIEYNNLNEKYQVIDNRLGFFQVLYSTSKKLKAEKFIKVQFICNRLSHGLSLKSI